MSDNDDSHNEEEKPAKTITSVKADFDSDSAKKQSLFKPEEMDIYVNKSTRDAYIFYGKTIDKEIEKLVYDPQDHSVTVVMKNGIEMDLGVKIQWLVRPYFTKAGEIFIVQTKNGETVDGFSVPLEHKKP